MSPSPKKAFIAKLNRRARRLSPDLAERQFRAWRIIRDSLNERELIEAINAGFIDTLLDRVLGDDVLDPAFAGLRQRLDRGVMDMSQTIAMNDLPGRMRGDVDVLNPEAVQAARALDTEVVSRLKGEVRDTFRQHVAAGIREGKAPQTIARGAKDMLGLAPNQEEAVRNFRSMIEAGDAEALTRKLRDRRFDPTLKKVFAGEKSLSKSQANRMVDAYRRRMISFNANTHARTAAVDAHKAGQRIAWEDAIRRDVVDRSRLKREWVNVGDSKVRPEHREVNGEVVGFDEPFSTGELIPGESTFNCRCHARTFVSRERAAA